VACYSLSISPLFWLTTAELFPNRLRAVGVSAAAVASWSAILLISVQTAAQYPGGQECTGSLVCMCSI
jgi:hypothetical protein